MSKIYLIKRVYSPNTAGINRLLSYAIELGKIYGVVELLFVFPNRQFDKYEGEIENVNITYLWDKYIGKHGRSYQSYLYILLDLWKMLDRGDTAFFFGCKEEMSFLSFKRGVKKYSEILEHPAIFHTSFIYKVIEKIYYWRSSKIDGVISITQGLRQLMIEHGCKPNRTCVVNMFVDRTRFEGTQPHKESFEYIAYCGALNTKKDGVHYLVEAFAKVSQEHGDLKLMLIGPKAGSEDAEIINTLVKKYALEDRVVFLGAVERESIPSLLLGAKMLVLARPQSKQAQYGFPTKLGEYLYSGTPVVTTDVGEISHFLKHRESSCIAVPDSIMSLYDNMIWLLENPDLAKEIGERGRTLACQCFDSHIEIQKIYRHFIAHNDF
ncbi:MAG: glycosyltransferase family 4 protein [Rikenellaceae bacterium]